MFKPASPRLATCALIATTSALLSAGAQAQITETVPATAQKQVRAVRVATPPVIDGRMDDAVWQQAEVITDFHQIRPGNQTEPSERTEVYVVYDDDAMYIAARMYDSEPDLIAAPVIRHGQGMGSDDRLVVILDPFNTQRTGYRFETNLNAARHEALYTSVNSFQIEWNTIWDTATSVDGNSWIAELEIPFKSLPFDASIDTWGFNFGRGIRRRGEEMAWVSYNRTYNPSISGLVTGLEGMDQGVGLDLVPSFSTSRNKNFSLNTTNSQTDPSLDAFYRLTPSLNAALTLNTDFSATEVDNRQVNLTRFNLFFPEKRDFFLNDSDLFQFGSIGGGFGNSAESRAARENARPYFSRKLGLSQTGAPVDIEYGGRISGRVGRWNIGTLAIKQDEFGAVNASNLFIGRVSANVMAESSVGMIFTDGDPGFEPRQLGIRAGLPLPEHASGGWSDHRRRCVVSAFRHAGPEWRRCSLWSDTAFAQQHRAARRHRLQGSAGELQSGNGLHQPRQYSGLHGRCGLHAFLPRQLSADRLYRHRCPEGERDWWRPAESGAGLSPVGAGHQFPRPRELSISDQQGNGSQCFRCLQRTGQARADPARQLLFQ
jgi:Ni/Co efflux regulator RcnB